MLSVTAVSDADYYLRSGCNREALSDERMGPADYELAAVHAGEPAGQWAGTGAVSLGLVGEVADADFRTLLNDLRDPRSGAALGSRPRKRPGVEDRVAAWVAAHPAATPEEVAAARVRAQAGVSASVHAWDMTFSLPKSWSVLHAALQRAGRAGEAEQVWAAARAGIDAALAHAQGELGWTRSGTGGPKVAGRVTTRYVRSEDWTMAVFAHHTSRERDPQLHAHVMVLNRAQDPDGRWRALYSPAITKNKHMLDATFLRVAEGELTRRLGVRFAARPDGVAREVVGVDARVRDLFSSRSRALNVEAQALVDQFTATYGRAPSALLRWQFAQQATLATRGAKRDGVSRDEDLARWEEKVAAEFRTGLGAVVDAVDAERADPDEAIVVEPLEPDVVIAQALADLEQSKAVWGRSHLYHAISQRMPDMLAIEPVRAPALIAELTDAALRGREVVAMAAPAVAPVPRELRDARTGRSVFEAPGQDRWTSAAHLAREDAVSERLERSTTVRLTEASARALLAEGGLSGEQLDVAVAVAASDRFLELVDAPAGTGKTTVMAALSRASAQTWGHGLTGFAVAQTAAENLAEHGVERGHNIARWLGFHDRCGRGEAHELEQFAMAVPRGAMVVVDEASMVDTPQLVRLVTALEERGAGKVVLIGDREQVDAIDAGGAFAMLCDQRGAHRLGTVRRFSHGWERDASVRVRDGDVEALAAYDARARIRGDSDRATVRDLAVGAFLTDHLSGLDSVIVVSSAEQAAEASSLIREELVRAGHVAADGIALHDRTVAGLGDLIQTRRNDRALGVVNRDVWQVVGTTSGGDLEVRRATGRDEHGRTWGAPQTLPAAYVAEHVELAYAGTVHAVQGRTTDTGHLLADRMMGRSRAYPGLTRGRDANHAWVVVEGEETPLGRFARIVETDDHVDAARTTLAAEQDRSDHLGHLGPQWQSIVTEERSGAHRGVLRAVLDERDADAVLDDRAAGGVLRLLRTAESAGHDPAALVRAAGARGPMAGARSPASVLHRRLDDALTRAGHRGGEVAREFTFAARTPQARTPQMLYASRIAAAMDARTATLGQRCADDPPEWALARWGPVPDDPIGRAGWAGRAAPVCAYREMWGFDHPRSAIGPQPARAEPERLWAWSRAADVLGLDPREREMAGLSLGELANRVQRWEREQAWMPRHVDDDLRETHAALEVARGAEVRARIGGEDPAEHTADVAAMRERVAVLEEIAAVRAQAIAATEDVRLAAQEAQEEVARRRALDDVERDEVPELGADPAPDLEAHTAVLERLRGHGDLDAVPSFGSAAWVGLSDHDPRRAVAVTRAAARWWNLGEPLDRDVAEVYARLAEHGLDGAADRDGHMPSRVLARIRAGEDEDEARAVEPSTDVDAVAAVRQWAVPHLTAGPAPAFGTREWADSDDRDVAEVRAALAWWNLGDDLDEVRARADAADDVVSARDISAAEQAHRAAHWDRRTAAEIAQARGDEPPTAAVDVEGQQREQEQRDEQMRREVVERAREHAEHSDDEPPVDDAPVQDRDARLRAELERARQAADILALREMAQAPAQRDAAPVERSRDRELAD